MLEGVEGRLMMAEVMVVVVVWGEGGESSNERLQGAQQAPRWWENRDGDCDLRAIAVTEKSGDGLGGVAAGQGRLKGRVKGR